jgi:uncharacterized membrane protein YccC
MQFVSGVAVSAGALFLVLAGWPASALGLTIAAIVCALSTTMPDPSKAVVAAIGSFALAAMSADIVHFYFLTDSQDFIRLAIAIAPTMIFGGLLSVNPKIAGIGVMINTMFLFLFAPSNPQTFNALSFFSQCMFVAFALGVVFLASRLVRPVSDLDKQRAVVRATKETLAASVTGRKYSSPALSIALASRIADYVAAATDKRRPHPEVLKGCSRPTTCRSRRLRPTLTWSRAQTIRPSAPGLARCNEPCSPEIAGDFTPAPDQFFDA